MVVIESGKIILIDYIVAKPEKYVPKTSIPSPIVVTGKPLTKGGIKISYTS